MAGEWAQAISNLGFPIAVCIAMGAYVMKIQDQYNQTLAKLTEAINNNTLIVAKLAEKMEKER